jgi:hypothetical protein
LIDVFDGTEVGVVGGASVGIARGATAAARSPGVSGATAATDAAVARSPGADGAAAIIDPRSTASVVGSTRAPGGAKYLNVRTTRACVPTSTRIAPQPYERAAPRHRARTARARTWLLRCVGDELSNTRTYEKNGITGVRSGS